MVFVAVEKPEAPDRIRVLKDWAGATGLGAADDDLHLDATLTGFAGVVAK